MKKTLLFCCTTLVVLMSLSNTETPFIGGLMAIMPFPKIYFWALFGLAAIFSFIFIVFPDPGDGKVIIKGTEKKSFNPDMRAIVISVSLLVVILLSSWFQNNFCVGNTQVSLLQVIFSIILYAVLLYGFILSIYAFFQQGENVWTKMISGQTYVHRGKGDRK